MPKPKPIAVTLASSKGGQSRSLLAACLSVRALKDGPVAIIDWEPQGSLSIWHKLRKSSEPFLHPTKGDLVADVAKLKGEGYRTIIIDTPPMFMEPIERAVAACDVCCIPTKIGLFDLAGIRPVIGFAKEHKRRFLFVITGTNDLQPGWPKLIRDARKVLKKFDVPIATKTIRERAVYISALNTGRTGPEIGTADGRGAAVEINALWQAIKRAAR